jgi:hypothetical protein
MDLAASTFCLLCFYCYRQIILPLFSENDTWTALLLYFISSFVFNTLAMAVQGTV